MTLKDCFFVACIGLWILVFPPKSFSAPLDYKTTAVIYNMAQALSKYKLPPIAPTVEYVSKERLAELVCKQVCPQINGAQVGDHIYLLDTLDMDDPFNRAILLHEAVHFLQYANKGPARDCEEYIQREYEAYGLQNYVLEKIGLRLKMPIMPSCS